MLEGGETVPVADTGITPTPCQAKRFKRRFLFGRVRLTISEMAGTAVPVATADDPDEVEVWVWVCDSVAVSVAAEVVEVWPPLPFEEEDDELLLPVSTLNWHCFSCLIWVEPSAAATGDRVTLQVVVIVPAWLYATIINHSQ